MNYATTIATGVAMLLGGLYTMRWGLRLTFSSSLQQPLQRLTKTPWRGLVAGTCAAALMQSSTAVTLCAIGLVSAGYLSFYQALGLILGANIGTCSTVQLLTLSPPSEVLLYSLAASLLAALISSKRRFIFIAVAGILAMFCGLNILSSGLENIAQLETVISYLSLAGENPLYGIASGILLTFLFQSSSAATGLLMMLFQEGLINLTTAIYGVYGNNIGSCLSSLLVGAAAPLAARRLAVAHFTLNVLGVIIFLPFSGGLAKVAAIFTGDFALQVALVHTLFNIISSLAVLPVIRPFSRLIAVLVPGKDTGI